MILAADLLGFSLPPKVYIIILLYIIYYILYKDYNTFNNIRTTFYHFIPKLHLSTNQAAILFPLHPFLSIVSANESALVRQKAD